MEGGEIMLHNISDLIVTTRVITQVVVLPKEVDGILI